MLASTFNRIPKWVFATAALIMCVVLAIIAVIPLLLSGANLASAPEGRFYGAEEYGFGGGASAPQSSDASDMAGEAEFAAVEAPASANTGILSDVTQQQAQVDRLIIRNGSVSVVVNDTQASRQTIEGIVAQYASEGAFVVYTNVSPTNSGQSPYIDMSIRVPAKYFDQVMKQLVGLAAEGTTPTSNESSEDVTNQYVDLDSRLSALEAARDRLLQIMAEAQTTEDLLYAEQQLTQREAEIESIKGQMQYLSQSAALSNITISLQPYIVSQPVDTSWNPIETARRAIEDLFESLQDAGDFLIGFVIFGLPWLVILGLIGYGGYRLVRWMFWRNKGKTPAASS